MVPPNATSMAHSSSPCRVKYRGWEPFPVLHPGERRWPYVGRTSSSGWRWTGGCCLEGIYLNVPCIWVRVQQPLCLSISLYGLHVGPLIPLIVCRRRKVWQWWDILSHSYPGSGMSPDGVYDSNRMTKWDFVMNKLYGPLWNFRGSDIKKEANIIVLLWSLVFTNKYQQVLVCN